jgi:acetyl-CoA acetyltransferase family protein
MSQVLPPKAERDAMIVAARRTPIGRRNGSLSTVHPHELLAAANAAVLADSGLAGGDLDMIVCGCVTQVGDQAYNIGRMAALSAGLPVEVPAMTLDSQCGSSQQAVNVAAALVHSGAAEVVLACGVESMSRVPLGSAQLEQFGSPYSASYLDRYELVTQGESAERIADRWQLTRADCDAWAERSQRLAAQATAAGRFSDEITPVPVGNSLVTSDEGIRESTAESLAALAPAFRPAGRHTAGNSSQISDGAAAVVVMARARARTSGAIPIARIAGEAFVGVDPVLKLTGAIPATATLLARGITPADIGLFEVSEAFASVALAWLAETHADADRVNVNGGAIALGHPVGASGARMIVTAAHEMRRRDAEAAVIAMCCGGGLGTGTLLVPE